MRKRLSSPPSHPAPLLPQSLDRHRRDRFQLLVGSQTLSVPGYDAGSEPNDELCASIPDPPCGGEGGSPNAGGEGFAHVQAGIHGIGDLSAADYDWRNPVATIKVERVR